MALQLRSLCVPFGTLFLLVGCGGDSSDQVETPYGQVPVGSSPLAEQDPDALIQEALGFLELGNAPSARDLLLRAIAIDESRAEAHHFLGRALMGMSRVSAGHEGNAASVGLSVDSEIQKQGIAALRRASELRPSDADYLYWLGRGLHLMGANAEAVPVLEQAIQQDPKHGMAHKRLGITHLDAGNPEQALPSFLEAEKLLPRDPGPAFQVGNLLLEEDPEGARDAYRRSIAADISFPGAYNGLIGVLSRLGDPEGSAQAKADFTRWNDYEARLQGLLGRAQNQVGDVDAQLDVADALLQKNDWAGARDYFLRSVLLDAKSEYAHLNLGILYQRLGEHEQAYHHLEETIFLRPTAVEPRLQLIGVCNALGKQERLGQLLALFERDLAKLDKPTHLRLADSLREAGLREEAEKHYRLILEANPGEGAALEGLNLLQATAGSR